MADEETKTSVPNPRLRWFTLAGLVPLAVFLVVHILVNASALGGAATYARVAGAVGQSPVVTAIELVLVFVPLAYHAIYGLKVIFAKAPPVRPYPLFPARFLRLMRLSGLVLFGFVFLHVWEIRWHRFTGALAASGVYTRLAGELSSTRFGVPLVAIGYLLALAAACFHLAVGVAAWRIDGAAITRPRAQRSVFIRAAVAGSVLFLVGALTVIAVATGGQMFGEATEAPPAPCGSAAH